MSNLIFDFLESEDLLMQEWSPYDGDAEAEIEANRSNSEDTDTSHVEEHQDLDHSHESDFEPDQDGDTPRLENGNGRLLLGQIHGEKKGSTRSTEIKIPAHSNYIVKTEEVFSSVSSQRFIEALLFIVIYRLSTFLREISN